MNATEVNADQMGNGAVCWSQDPSCPTHLTYPDRGAQHATIRECYAALALQGLLAGQHLDPLGADEVDVGETCALAVRIADELIRALNGEKADAAQ